MLGSSAHPQYQAITPHQLRAELNGPRALVTLTHGLLASDANQATVAMVNTAERKYEIQASVFAKYQNDTQKSYLKTILNNSEFSHRFNLKNLNVDTLLSKEYMTDEAINEYFKLIDFEHQGVVARNSFDLVEGKFSSFFENIVNNAHLNRPTRQEAIATLKEANLILLPIHEGMHWYLMAIHKNEANHYNLFCLDSLNITISHTAFLNKISTLLKALNPECTIESRKSIIVPVQTLDMQGGDCGAAICYYAARIAQDPAWLYASPDYRNSICDYAQYRWHIAHVLANEIAKDAQVQTQMQAQTFPQEAHLQNRNTTSQRATSVLKILLIASCAAFVTLGMSLLLAVALKLALTLSIYTFLSVNAIGILRQRYNDEQSTHALQRRQPASSSSASDDEVEEVMSISASPIITRTVQKPRVIIEITDDEPTRKSTAKI